MEVTYSKNARRGSLATQDIMLPRPWSAAGGLFAFFVLGIIGSFFYIFGCHLYLEAELTAQGAAVDQETLQAQIDAHLLSPAAIASMYAIQLVMILPALLVAADFNGQSRWETLGVRPFSVKVGCLWLAIFAVYQTLEIVVFSRLDIPSSEFITALEGSRHLVAALVITFAAPLFEELIFRGYLFKAWRHSRLGLSGTLVLTSVLFTLAHWGQYQWQMLSSVFVFSLIMGLAREKSGSVLLPMLLHSIGNGLFSVLAIYQG